MAGNAKLSVSIGDAWTGIVKVTWEEGSELDAVASVPERFRGSWAKATAQTKWLAKQAGGVAPYPTVPVFVDPARVGNSTVGIYAVAKLLFDQVAWTAGPPYLGDKRLSIPKGAVS